MDVVPLIMMYHDVPFFLGGVGCKTYPFPMAEWDEQTVDLSEAKEADEERATWTG